MPGVKFGCIIQLDSIKKSTKFRPIRKFCLFNLEYPLVLVYDLNFYT